MNYENSDNTGNRIRIERSRLGLSQEQFGALIGKKKIAIYNYERNERSMSHTDLEALHQAGVDVWFLITGERANIVPLPKEEQDVLKLFHQVDPSQRETLLTLVRNFVGSFPAK